MHLNLAVAKFSHELYVPRNLIAYINSNSLRSLTHFFPKGATFAETTALLIKHSKNSLKSFSVFLRYKILLNVFSSLKSHFKRSFLI